MAGQQEYRLNLLFLSVHLEVGEHSGIYQERMKDA